MTRRTNIAEQDAPLIGRATDAGELDRMLRAHRLVTVTGPAGVGKTALATWRAGAALKANSGGVWFCDLTEATTIDDLCRTLARALDVPLGPGADAMDQLGGVLASRGRILVVLDNVEQFVALAAGAVSAWLISAPAARFLVTSRERLRVKDEVVLELAPLRVPPEGDDAVELFVERVRAGGGNARLDEGDLSIIGEIVRQLDGLPLAIELAAARSGVLSPAQILAHLPRRFELLGAGRRGASERQRTLRGAIEWSWRLCEPWEQRALAQCSIFRGGFALEAAEAVLSLEGFAEAESTLDVLQALHDKSLLRTERAAAEQRYTLYASVREFAATTLSAVDEAAVVSRHSAYYARAASEWSRSLGKETARDGMAHLLLELNNILAVVSRGLEDGPEDAWLLALRTLVELEAFFAARGPYASYVALIDRALRDEGRPKTDVGLAADLLVARGRTRIRQGLLMEAERDVLRALDLVAADRRRRAGVRAVLAVLHVERGRRGDARAEFELALADVGDDDPRAQADLLLKMGFAEATDGRNEAARAAFQRSAELFQICDDRRSLALCLVNLAEVQTILQRTEDASATNVRALALAHELGDRRIEAISAGCHARLLREQGDAALALKAIDEAVRVLVELGDRPNAGQLLGVRATMLFTDGHLAEARRDYRAAVEILAESASGRNQVIVYMFLGGLELLLGDRVAAALAFTEVERRRAYLDERGGAVALGLLRAIDEVFSGRASEVEALLDAAKSFAAESSLVRDAIKVLERVLRSHAPSVLRIGPEGRWFEAAHKVRADLSSREALRLVLVRLVDAHARAPGEPVGSAALLASGWPGERVSAGAGANRVRVAVSTLRRLGLRGWLLSTADGWLLDPSRTIARDAG